MKIQNFLTILIFLILSTTLHAAQTTSSKCSEILTTTLAQISTENLRNSCQGDTATLHLLDTQSITFSVDTLPIAPKRPFYGLAAYYNIIHILHMSQQKIENVKSDQVIQMNDMDWLVISGRFNVILMKAPNATAEITDQTIQLNWPADSPANLILATAPKTNLSEFNPEWGDLRYQHLWGWLGKISKAVEWSLVKIHANIISNWGWAIVIFALLLKILLLPVSIMTLRLQQQVSKYQSILAPQLADIKNKYDGEEAHNRIMAAHKALGITPFYTLKPMIGALIQIPIWIAIFNALGEMYQFSGASFLWIKDLSYPGSIASLPFFIPFFGDTLNLLPIIMTIVTLLSTLAFQVRYSSTKQLSRQKRNLYFMAAVFFVLFYPFPAVMVLYWMLANLLQAIQQKVSNPQKDKQELLVKNHP